MGVVPTPHFGWTPEQRNVILNISFSRVGITRLCPSATAGFNMIIVRLDRIIPNYFNNKYNNRQWKAHAALTLEFYAIITILGILHDPPAPAPAPAHRQRQIIGSGHAITFLADLITAK